MRFFFIKGLIIYSKIYSFILYHAKNTPFLKTICKAITCFFIKYTEFYYQIKKEKPNNWCNISYVKYTKENKPVYVDFYKYLIPTPNPPIRLNILKYNTCLEEIDKKIINDSLMEIKHFQHYVHNYLMTIRHNNYYYYKIINFHYNLMNSIQMNCFPMNFIKSDVSFIAIEYIHPLLKEPIPINIKNIQFVIGSEILNSTFIYRFLKYTYGNKIPFSINYTLRIIDSKFSIFELRANQYIELHRSLYLIKDVFYCPELSTHLEPSLETIYE